MKDGRHFRLGVWLGGLGILLVAIPAAGQEARIGFQGGPYVGVCYSSVSGPTFRFPSDTGQMSVSQSKGVAGFLAGYDVGSSYAGFGVRGLYFGTAFQSFATPDMPGAQDLVNYADPKYAIFMGDLMVFWAPARSTIFSIYGFLGLGASSKKYTVSNSVFPEWNGAKSLSEFEYSYGLGVRVRPIARVSAFAEFRLIPGDQILEGKNFLYSDGTYDYYEYADSFTSHFTRVLAAGLALHF